MKDPLPEMVACPCELCTIFWAPFTEPNMECILSGATVFERGAKLKASHGPDGARPTQTQAGKMNAKSVRHRMFPVGILIKSGPGISQRMFICTAHRIVYGLCMFKGQMIDHMDSRGKRDPMSSDLHAKADSKFFPTGPTLRTAILHHR